MLVLSTGAARRPRCTPTGFAGDTGQAWGLDKQSIAPSPEGFPKPSPVCPSVEKKSEPHDAAALEVRLRAPSNARAFSFDFNFYTREWPSWFCNSYNDVFAAIMAPKPAALADGNISFDLQGSPITVDNAFLAACGCASGPPCPAPSSTHTIKNFLCPLGVAPLECTGFMSGTEAKGAATGWLSTSAPVPPRAPGGPLVEIVLRFAIWDSHDGLFDSSVLIDNWRWKAEPADVATTVVKEPR